MSQRKSQTLTRSERAERRESIKKANPPYQRTSIKAKHRKTPPPARPVLADLPVENTIDSAPENIPSTVSLISPPENFPSSVSLISPPEVTSTPLAPPPWISRPSTHPLAPKPDPQPTLAVTQPPSPQYSPASPDYDHPVTYIPQPTFTPSPQASSVSPDYDQACSQVSRALTALAQPSQDPPQPTTPAPLTAYRPDPVALERRPLQRSLAFIAQPAPPTFIAQPTVTVKTPAQILYERYRLPPPAVAPKRPGPSVIRTGPNGPIHCVAQRTMNFNYPIVTMVVE